MGIEPTSEAWEASILPLYDARSGLPWRLYTTAMTREKGAGVKRAGHFATPEASGGCSLRRRRGVKRY